jgi:hypothetical protein
MCAPTAKRPRAIPYRSIDGPPAFQLRRAPLRTGSVKRRLNYLGNQLILWMSSQMAAELEISAPFCKNTQQVRIPNVLPKGRKQMQHETRVATDLTVDSKSDATGNMN